MTAQVIKYSPKNGKKKKSITYHIGELTVSNNHDRELVVAEHFIILKLNANHRQQNLRVFMMMVQCYTAVLMNIVVHTLIRMKCNSFTFNFHCTQNSFNTNYSHNLTCF